MYKILFINHKIKRCGVYQYGLRLYNIIKKNKYKIIYKEIDSVQEYNNFILEDDYNLIFYNYHDSTMTWLTKETIQKKVPNVGITHESNKSLFDYNIEIDPTSKDDFSIPRPIFDININELSFSDNNIEEFTKLHQNENIPIIGSFGFGFNFNKFIRVVEYVNEEFDNAIIKMIIPFAYFGDNEGYLAKSVIDICKSKAKEGVKIYIINKFIEENDLLKFLESNTINLFLYDPMFNRGCSSTIDYALSTTRPLGISDSDMFRHIYDDSICIYKTSIKYCIENSVEYISKIKKLYSHENLINKINYIIEKVVQN
jgi:hypothetical protein